MKFAELITVLMRNLEYLLTGQSNFRLEGTSDFAVANVIDNEVQAKIALKEVRLYLKENFYIEILQPVIIKLGQVQTLDWKSRLTSGFFHIGNCSTKQMGHITTHEITVVPGLERVKFKSVICHELTHAFQSEKRLLRNFKGYKEGMARWTEYHFLLDNHLEDEAQKLRRFEMALLGKMLNKILDFEKEHGREATLQWLQDMELET